jgi:divalent metal cation (Fe/Co/Zn/Cd) transporter
VLGGGFVFEAASLGVALHSLHTALGRRSMREYWRESRDPTLPTVVLEDSAALTSLVVAAVGIWLSQRLGTPLPDALASGVIGLIRITVAVLLAFQSYSLLIGESAPRDVEEAIRRAAREDPEGHEVVSLHTTHLGPDAVLIVLGVRFRPGLETADVEAAVERLHRRVEDAVGHSTRPRLIVIEPRRPGAEALGSAA